MDQKKQHKSTAVRAKKHLGQHFLSDELVAKNITDLIFDVNSGRILEIGPGMGVLSKYIATYIKDKNILFTMVEYDRESIDYLKKSGFYDSDNIEILNRDILRYDFTKIPEKTAIIGNLPYNISSPIFFKILENSTHIDNCVFMVQKEVADRICSQHGSKVFGILSVLLQSLYYCETKFDVAPDSFIPPPKVTSTVFTMKKKPEPVDTALIPVLKTLVKKAFNQRRKMLRNTIGEELLSIGNEYEKYLTLRPEQLSVQDFILIAEAIKSK